MLPKIFHKKIINIELFYDTIITIHIFNNNFSQFDRLLNGCKGYDPKLHRDDRANAKSRGLHVNDEERKRTVPRHWLKFGLYSKFFNHIYHFHRNPKK